MRRNQIRVARSNEALLKGLESLLYEMVILATALLLRDKRHFFERYPKLQWGLPQIAHDVIRLKSRLLLDFFYPVSFNHDDMQVSDYGLARPIPALNPHARQRLTAFRTKVNKWTIHLSWTRTTDTVYDKPDREAMEQYGLDLLGIGEHFLDQCLSNGYELDGWAEAYYDNFKRLYSGLKETSRIEEGRGIRPKLRLIRKTLLILLIKKGKKVFKKGDDLLVVPFRSESLAGFSKLSHTTLLQGTGVDKDHLCGIACR